METEHCHPCILEAASHSISPPRGTTPHITLPQAQPYSPSPSSSATLIPNQSRASGKKQTKPVFFFFSSNRKIYFNCCNTVDYKRLLCMTEHSTSCIYVGLLVPGASRWLLRSPLLAHLFPAILLLDEETGMASSPWKGELAWLQAPARPRVSSAGSEAQHRAASQTRHHRVCGPAPGSYLHWTAILPAQLHSKGGNSTQASIGSDWFMSVPFYI